MYETCMYQFVCANGGFDVLMPSGPVERRHYPPPKCPRHATSSYCWANIIALGVPLVRPIIMKSVITSLPVPDMALASME